MLGGEKMGTSLKTIGLAMVLIVAILGAGSAQNQAIAQKKLQQQLIMKKFEVSPLPFKKGQTLSFKVVIENPNNSTVDLTHLTYDTVFLGIHFDGMFHSVDATTLPILGPKSRTTFNFGPYTFQGTSCEDVQFDVKLPRLPDGNPVYGPVYHTIYKGTCTYTLKKLPFLPKRR
jgi:hypothetical protein